MKIAVFVLLLVDNPVTFTHSLVNFCSATCFSLYGHHQAQVNVFKLLPCKNMYVSLMMAVQAVTCSSAEIYERVCKSDRITNKK
jgi:hypothetical protein